MTRVRNAALFLALAAVWWSAFMAITAGLAYFPPVLFAAVRLTPAALLALASLSVVASAVGFLVDFDLLERLGPVRIHLVSYVAPLFAALSGWAVLGETPTAATPASSASSPGSSASPATPCARNSRDSGALRDALR